MNAWIKNGHLLDPATNRDGMFDLLIKDGKVVAVGSFSEEEVQGYEVLDATGKYVMPGFIDLHTHLREPGFEYKETITTGTKAAAKGGFTAVCPMPNTNPVIDNKEMIEQLLTINEKEGSGVRLYPVGAITKGQEGQILADIKEMVLAGAKAISEDGKSVMNAKLYREAMIEATEQGIPILAHCEDKDIADGGYINAGKRSEQLGLKGISHTAEDTIIARDIILAKETRATLHICHCSTKDSMNLIKFAKDNGCKVTGEVCPHHFVLSEEEVDGRDANFKMNPPLRSKRDVQVIKEGLSYGVMDVIATDHAPHSEEEKKTSFADAPFGIVGLETAFALTVTHLVLDGYLTPMQMVEKFSLNPARILGVDGGCLREDSPADIVIADMDEKYKIDKHTFVSKGKNTPFDGNEVVGRIEKTMVGGNVIYSR